VLDPKKVEKNIIGANPAHGTAVIMPLQTGSKRWESGLLVGDWFQNVAGARMIWS